MSKVSDNYDKLLDCVGQARSIESMKGYQNLFIVNRALSIEIQMKLLEEAKARANALLRSYKSELKKLGNIDTTGYEEELKSKYGGEHDE